MPKLLETFISFLRRTWNLRALLGLIPYGRELGDAHSALVSSPDYPNSAVRAGQGALLAIQGSAVVANRLIKLSGQPPIQILKHDRIRETIAGSSIVEAEALLRTLLDHHGSDKGTWHEYSFLYALIISNFLQGHPIRILEIGLGTNSVDVPSNMGPQGRPGASLRAFREFDTRIECVGLDVDPRALFEEPRIRTGLVDQMKPGSWDLVDSSLLNEKFDLIIDDGLHSPTANFNTIIASRKHLGASGIFVVEDIPEKALDVWNIISALRIEGFELRIVQFPKAYCAVISRQGSMPTALS